MTDDERRRILEQVAAGEVTPDEGAARLHALDHPGEAGPDEGAWRDDAWDAEDLDDDEGRTGRVSAPATASGRARRVRVESTAANVRILGDDDVAEAVAEGGCTMRRDGATLVVESELLPLDDWAQQAAYVVRFGGRHRTRARVRGTPFTRPEAVRVRMNPDLPLEVVVNAGAVRVSAVRSPITCDVAAGTVRIDGFRSPLDCTVHAGSLSARGVLDRGESELSCDAGAIRVDLEPGSSVALDVAVNLGKVDVEGFDHDPDTGGFVLGRGDARLDVRGSLGKVRVRARQ